jgi:predicted phage tail component-like protein
MNYCILNGVKSTTIKGLLIQSLPPISKPLMRTSVEEIDGRDGDIVTKLGYSAYDKQMSIGLFGDYDVDEVIQFFDSEGTVIFSNEPDKFYKYQIIEQIDFERLLRFKTATVTFHVQPFKYSAVDDDYSFSSNELSVKNYSATKNGVTINAENGVISLQGTATSAVEFYVPISAMPLGVGGYTLKALTDGTGESCCSIRVIGSVPSDADSFGGTYLPLQNSGEASMTASLAAQKTFNYVWFYITSGTAMNFTLNVQMLNNDVNSFSVFNRGNTIARPALTIYGSGTINLSINGQELFTIALGDAEFITLDGAQMNAYQGNILMNRAVAGDYDYLVLNVGTNVISWVGNVTQVEVVNGSRWI